MLENYKIVVGKYDKFVFSSIWKLFIFVFVSIFYINLCVDCGIKCICIFINIGVYLVKYFLL